MTVRRGVELSSGRVDSEKFRKLYKRVREKVKAKSGQLVFNVSIDKQP